MSWWKKKEEPSEEPEFEEDFGLNERPRMPTDSGFERSSMERPMSSALSKLSEVDSHGVSSGDVSKDIQLILAKLDSIQHLLDNLNQRIKNLERIAESE
ncbi:hypothetical protein HZA97_07315 [Candidatus Woesearchaeota archaeon]|nr:hypothetical protein [Candidatus Woesearchaeota archaeon]